MIRIITMLTVCFVALFSITTQAQVLPAISINDLQGNSIDVKTIEATTDKPIVIAFWATWCIPCINELSAINENLEDWKSTAKFDFYAISQDDSRTAKRVQPMVNGKRWDFTVLLDKNQDFKRVLNIVSIPYTIIIKNGKIVYQHAGYVAGNEEALFKIIQQHQ